MTFRARFPENVHDPVVRTFRLQLLWVGKALAQNPKHKQASTEERVHNGNLPQNLSQAKNQGHREQEQIQNPIDPISGNVLFGLHLIRVGFGPLIPFVEGVFAKLGGGKTHSVGGKVPRAAIGCKTETIILMILPG